MFSIFIPFFPDKKIISNLAVTTPPQLPSANFSKFIQYFPKSDPTNSEEIGESGRHYAFDGILPGRCI